jgi:hypothetical protein
MSMLCSEVYGPKLKFFHSMSDGPPSLDDDQKVLQVPEPILSKVCYA